MQDSTKQFLEALNSATGGTLIWHGLFPDEIRQVFNISADAQHVTLFGIKVTRKPLYHVE